MKFLKILYLYLYGNMYGNMLIYMFQTLQETSKNLKKKKTVRCITSVLSEWLSSKRSQITKVSGDVEKGKLLYTLDVNVK